MGSIFEKGLSVHKACVWLAVCESSLICCGITDRVTYKFTMCAIVTSLVKLIFTFLKIYFSLQIPLKFGYNQTMGTISGQAVSTPEHTCYAPLGCIQHVKDIVCQCQGRTKGASTHSSGENQGEVNSPGEDPELVSGL